MNPNPDRRQSAFWAVLATVVLVVRILATIVLILCLIGWVLVAVRSSLDNAFLWPTVISGAALLTSTYIYSYLRPRHPRHNGWVP